MGSENNLDSTFGRRMSDLGLEPHTMLMPIEGYESMPLVSLEKAVIPLIPLVRDIKHRACIARRRWNGPFNGLSADESASITLYTAPWEPSTDSLYYILNTTLRTEDRNKLKPWFSYLKLFLTALNRLKPMGKYNIYRGVTCDLRPLHPKGKQFVWWGFSSCTTDIEILKNEEFFGNTKPRTLFNIECTSGRDIHEYSYIPRENEVLLLACTKLEVVGCLEFSSDCSMIQLKEIENFPCEQKLSKTNSSLSHIVPRAIIEKIISRTINHKIHRLEQLIQNAGQSSSIILDRQLINDKDINYVIQRAIDKECVILRLSKNLITSTGAKSLAEMLQWNRLIDGLNLFGNKISDEGTKYLAEVLQTENKTLRSLSLGGNGITDIGAKYLADMLMTNTQLLELYLPWNKISDSGVQLLAESLINYNRSLKTLNLHLNESITDSSASVLIELIGRSQSLTFLSVSSSKLSKATRTRLSDAAKLKTHFALQLDAHTF